MCGDIYLDIVGEHSLDVSNPYQILTSFSLFSIDSVRDIPVSKSGGQQQSDNPYNRLRSKVHIEKYLWVN